MRSLFILIVLAVLATGPVARAAGGNTPPPLPDGYDGWLLIYVIPPSGPITWTKPGDVAASAIVNNALAKKNVKAGRVYYGHPIGHLHVEMQCSKGSETETIAITGMTSDDESWTAVGDGLGIFLREFPGRLDFMETKDGKGGRTKVLNDLSNRKAAVGYLGIMRFPITWVECKHLSGYYFNYRLDTAYRHYGSQFRPRGFTGASGVHEGGGCSAFGVSFIDVAGLLPRPMMTSKWARQLLLGHSLIANVGGRGYPYGSNLIASVADFLWTWPVKAEAPAVASPINGLDEKAWYTQAEFDASQVVPLTLYDPELIYNDLSMLWTKARAGVNNGWKAWEDNKAYVIDRDRGACPPKPNLKPYIDKVHNLNEE
jgi:hypothetical protein